MFNLSSPNKTDLSHLALFAMVITCQGAFAISALAAVTVDQENQLTLTMTSGDEFLLNAQASQEFLQQTQAMAMRAQQTVVTPYGH